MLFVWEVRILIIIVITLLTSSGVHSSKAFSDLKGRKILNSWFKERIKNKSDCKKPAERILNNILRKTETDRCKFEGWLFDQDYSAKIFQRLSNQYCPKGDKVINIKGTCGWLERGNNLLALYLIGGMVLFILGIFLVGFFIDP